MQQEHIYGQQQKNKTERKTPPYFLIESIPVAIVARSGTRGCGPSILAERELHKHTLPATLSTSTFSGECMHNEWSEGLGERRGRVGRGVGGGEEVGGVWRG